MKNQIKKILIIRFGAIGDVVATSGLFRALKKQDHSLEIHYLTFKVPSMLIENDPDIYKAWILKDKNYRNLFKMGMDLKKESYDLILNLQPSIRTKFLCSVIGAKKQLIYNKTYKMNAVENFFSTALPIYKDLSLEKNIYIYVPEKTKEEVKAKLPKNKFICLNIGTSPGRHGRRWPIEYWAELAKSIKEKYGYEIILSGGKEDIQRVNELMELFPNSINLCGQLSLMESAALWALAETMVCGDTGPLHIATAVGTKCIGIYGCPSVSRTGPYGEGHLVAQSQLECVPCDKKTCRFNSTKEDKAPCMYDIKPKQVMKLVDKILN